LSQIEQGDPAAADQLLPLVYDELRQLAAAKLVRENPGQTLEATALVHEAYVKLVGSDQSPHWAGRTHFFRAAAEAMRRVLVDNARRKLTVKHGGTRQAAELEQIVGPETFAQDDVLAINEALEKLAQHDAEKAELVKLRYFAGLTLEEAAAALGLSRATADRHWRYAKTWLYCELMRSHDSGQP
jgi:RNA polymerase sigma factor (TIGR02999 family)